MLYKFKNGTTQDPAGKDRTKIRLLQQFDEANLRLQIKFADWLERKTAHWSSRSWTIILIFFTIATSSCSIYVMVDSFSEPDRSSIPITRIVKTTNTIQTQEKMDQLKVLISKGEDEKTIRFRRYKDSLVRSRTGKKIKDSINQNRPGLLDSLDKVDKYYHLQNKK
ncbi:MAG: hypothetical protein PHF81_10325 [Flavobacterium sp.]|nr:hypothetical protein [Flavobacterium sp.]